MSSTLLSIALLVIAVATPVFADGVDRLFHFDNDWVLKINLKDFKLMVVDFFLMISKFSNLQILF